jgi:hypothetical protein
MPDVCPLSTNNITGIFYTANTKVRSWNSSAQSISQENYFPENIFYYLSDFWISTSLFRLAFKQVYPPKFFNLCVYCFGNPIRVCRPFLLSSLNSVEHSGKYTSTWSYDFCVILIINIDHFLKHNQPIDLCNEDASCYLWGRDWIKYYLD